MTIYFCSQKLLRSRYGLLYTTYNVKTGFEISKTKKDTFLCLFLVRLNSLREEETTRQDYEVAITVIKEPVDAPSLNVTPSPLKEDTVVSQSSKSTANKKKKK